MKTKFLVLILIMGLITACASQPTEAPVSAPTEEPASPTEVPPTEVPPSSSPATDTAVPATEPPTAEPTAGPTSSPIGLTTVSFSRDILPILESRCLNCHGGSRTQEGLNVRNYASLMAGSDNGPVIVPGSADGSLFVEMVASQDMPKRGPKLTPEQVQLFRDWVNEGALDN